MYAADLESPSFQIGKPNGLDVCVKTGSSLDAVPTKFMPTATIAELDRAEEERKKDVHEAIQLNLPLGITIPAKAKSPVHRESSKQYTAANFNDSANTQMSQQWSLGSSSPPKQHSSGTPYYNSRMSDMSSLSSGFGDAQIDVPESGSPSSFNSRSQTHSLTPGSTQNRGNPISHLLRNSFSISDNRDTMYTMYNTTSDDGPTRFRTINSWVIQQSRSVMRRKESDAEVVNMPEVQRESLVDMPAPLQPAARMMRMIHRRLSSGSTNPAFRAHPGDEVIVGAGSRVPSMILDKKLEL